MARPRSPLLGYNHNVKYKGRVFHVQTEDSGPGKAHLFTHLFFDGTILATKRQNYDDASAEDPVKALMQGQHKAILKELRHGHYDDKLIAFFRGRGESLEAAPGVVVDAHGALDLDELPVATGMTPPPEMPPELAAAGGPGIYTVKKPTRETPLVPMPDESDMAAAAEANPAMFAVPDEIPFVPSEAFTASEASIETEFPAILTGDEPVLDLGLPDPAVPTFAFPEDDPTIPVVAASSAPDETEDEPLEEVIAVAEPEPETSPDMMMPVVIFEESRPNVVVRARPTPRPRPSPMPAPVVKQVPVVVQRQVVVGVGSPPGQAARPRRPSQAIPYVVQEGSHVPMNKAPAQQRPAALPPAAAPRPVAPRPVTVPVPPPTPPPVVMARPAATAPRPPVVPAAQPPVVVAAPPPPPPPRRAPSTPPAPPPEPMELPPATTANAPRTSGSAPPTPTPGDILGDKSLDEVILAYLQQGEKRR